MDNRAPSILSLVLIPAVLTLVVTVLRLVGELQGWDHPWVNNTAPGAADEGLALIGISFLIFVFGFWFGFKLRRATGEPRSVGKAALLYIVAIAITMGGFAALESKGIVSMPSPDAPGAPVGLGYMMGLLAVSCVVGIAAWPRLSLTLLVYGFLARIPVAILTYVAVNKDDWDTHYSKLPNHMVAEGNDALMALIMPQITVWPAATLMLGGLLGCIGARIAGRHPGTQPEL